MSKLIMMRGLPASGKSTKANEIVMQGGWVRVNRDLLRTMLHFDKWSPRNEGKTVDSQKALVRSFLTGGTNVVVDDTNLGDKHRQMWSGIAKECDAKFEVNDLETPVDVCIERDEQRNPRVGSHVITQMALQYSLYPQQQKPLVLCDIDGTVADVEHRRHFVSDPENKNWQGFFEHMVNDTPRLAVIEQLGEKVLAGHEVIFLTARPEFYRDMTEEWLKENVPSVHPLAVIMRRDGDTRPDTEVKEQMYNTYFQDKYPVECIFDDRPSVIRMWKEKGINVIDVGDGVDF